MGEPAIGAMQRKPARQSPSPVQVAPFPPVPMGAVQSVNGRMAPIRSWKRSHSLPVGQPVCVTALQVWVQSEKPGTAMPVPSLSCRMQSPPAHSPSVVHMCVQTFTAVVPVDTFRHMLVAVQFELVVQAAPAFPDPAGAQTRAVPAG